MKLKIAHFYPELLNLYGDKGNIRVLQKRCEWRGIETEIKEINIEDKIDFSDIDIAFIGGGSEREELIAYKKLFKERDKIKAYTDDNGVLLGILGGFHMLGKKFSLNGEELEGLSIIDAYTTNCENRLTSNVVADSKFGKITGFESHTSRTFIGDNEPLGEVLYGYGNNGEDKKEGIIFKNVIGTNLCGPLLPKNPKLSDYIIKKALERKEGKEISLSELKDIEETLASEYIESLYISK